jgi:hypothetical protein
MASATRSYHDKLGPRRAVPPIRHPLPYGLVAVLILDEKDREPSASSLREAELALETPQEDSASRPYAGISYTAPPYCGGAS